MKKVINFFSRNLVQGRVGNFVFFVLIMFINSAFNLNTVKIQEPKREVKKTGSVETKTVKRKEASLLKKSSPKKIIKQEKRAEKKQEKKDLKQELEREEKAKM